MGIVWSTVIIHTYCFVCRSILIPISGCCMLLNVCNKWAHLNDSLTSLWCKLLMSLLPHNHCTHAKYIGLMKCTFMRSLPPDIHELAIQCLTPWIQEVVYLYMLIIVTCLILSAFMCRWILSKEIATSIYLFFLSGRWNYQMIGPSHWFTQNVSYRV